MSLITDNFKITHKNIIDEDTTGGDDEYLFSAYPDKSTGCKLGNKIVVLGYKFDLILDVQNFNQGDIVRGDISLDSSTIKATTGKGALQDLITDQILSIMTNR